MKIYILFLVVFCLNTPLWSLPTNTLRTTEFKKEAAYAESLFDDQLQKIDDDVSKHRRFVRDATDKHENNSLTAAVEFTENNEKPANQRHSKISAKEVNTSGSLNEKDKANAEHAHERKTTSKNVTNSDKENDEIKSEMTPHRKFGSAKKLSHFRHKLTGNRSKAKSNSTEAQVNYDESKRPQSPQNESTTVSSKDASISQNGNPRLAKNSEEASNMNNNKKPLESSKGQDKKNNLTEDKSNTTVSPTTSAQLANDNEKYRFTEPEKNLDNTKNSQKDVIPLKKNQISPSPKSIITGNQNAVLTSTIATSENMNNKNEQSGEKIEEAKYRQNEVIPDKQHTLSQKTISDNAELTNGKGSEMTPDASSDKVRSSKQDIITVTENTQITLNNKKMNADSKTTTTTAASKKSRTGNKSDKKIDKTKHQSPQRMTKSNKNVLTSTTVTEEMTNNKTNESAVKHRQNEAMSAKQHITNQEFNSDSAKSINEKENQTAITPEANSDKVISSRQEAATTENSQTIADSKKMNLDDKTESMTTYAASITQKEDARRDGNKSGQNLDKTKYPENDAVKNATATITETAVSTDESITGKASKDYRVNKTQFEKQASDNSKDDYEKNIAVHSSKTEPERHKDIMDLLFLTRNLQSVPVQIQENPNAEQNIVA